MPPVASTTARAAMTTGLAPAIASLAQLNAGDRGRPRSTALRQRNLRAARIEGVSPHGVDQRRHDRVAGHVAAHMHDASRRMRGLAADREPAFEVAVEGSAVTQQVVDAAPALRAPDRARLLRRPGPAPAAIVSAACASGAVALADRGGDAALRPGGRGAFAERRGGEITVTGRGASFSAQNRPARPPPTMTTLSGLRVRS